MRGMVFQLFEDYHLSQDEFKNGFNKIRKKNKELISIQEIKMHDEINIVKKKKNSLEINKINDKKSKKNKDKK